MIILHILKKIIYDKWAIVFNSILILLSVIFMMAYFLELDSYTNYKMKLAETFKGSSYISSITDEEVGKIKENFPDITYDIFYTENDPNNRVFVHSGTSLELVPCSYYEERTYYAFMEEIELISGELFDPKDAGKYVIIDEDEAMKCYSNLNVVGSTYYLEDKDENEISLKIVGVVKNSRRKEMKNNDEIYNSIYLPFNIYENLYSTSNKDLLIHKEFSAKEEEIIKDLLSIDKIQTYSNDRNSILKEKNMNFINNLILIMVPFVAGMLGMITYLIYMAMDTKAQDYLDMKKPRAILNYFLEYLIRIIIVNLPASLIGLAIGLVTLNSKGVSFIINPIYLIMLLLIFLIVIPLIFTAIVLIPAIVMVCSCHKMIEGSDLNG